MADKDTNMLEAHRVRLEDSLQKLRKALKVWQEQSAEYEGLHEELSALPENASRDDMLAIAKDFGGTVITEKEISSLVINGRTVKQVADAVARRIDYVQGNVKQVQKQLDVGEEKLDAVKVVIKPDAITNEEGLPLMEIREELDEEGNVIESSVAPDRGSAVPLSLDGIKAFKPYINETQKTKDTDVAIQAVTTPESHIESPATNLAGRGQVSATQNNVNAIDTTSTKSDVKVLVTKPEATTPNQTSTSDSNTNFKDKAEGIASIKIQNDDENDSGSDVDSEFDFRNAPEVEEDEESAQMRRDMIKYNLNEIGAIVAEINLEEDDLSSGESEMELDLEDDEDSEDEDEYGRSTRQVVTAQVKREMQVLQDKMQAREDQKKQDELTRINDNERSKEKIKHPVKTAKKGVRFAEKLDIAPEPAQSKVEDEGGEDDDVDPSILDMVFGPGTKDADARAYQVSSEQPREKGHSLFKAARMYDKAKAGILQPNDNKQKSTAQNISETSTSKHHIKPLSTAAIQMAALQNSRESPPDQEDESEEESSKPILANTIIERPPPTIKNSSLPQPPDELDADIVRQEINMSYHKMKNKLIQQQGGYKETDEEKQFVPLDENGERKKVSRFKARRLESKIP